jgi:hemolysin activation/secretion protein
VVGRAGLPTRDDLRPVPESETTVNSRLSVVSDIERSPCPLADPKFAGVTVPVNSVTFNNLRGVSVEDLRPAWAAYAGTRQPVAVLCDIRDAAATILRERGYLAAVQVPTQRIENGDIQMEMLYARVVAVRARGETQGAESMIARYLKHLTDDEIFDRNRAERYLLLARDLPGYNIQLTLKPAGTNPGEVIGEVTVLSRRYAVDFTAQNLSSRAAGRWGGQVRAQAFGLTGMGDATSIAFFTTSDFEEQRILQAAHEFRLGSEGLKIGLQFTHAWTDPDIGLPNGDTPLKARTIFGSVDVSYPLIRRQSHSLLVAGGLDIVNQRVNFAGVALTRDQLRVGFVRLSGEAVDLKSQAPLWRVAGNVELRKGVNIFGATDCGLLCGPGLAPSRLDGDPTGGLIRLSGTGELALGKRLALSVAPRLQVALDPLFAFEEFSAGNYTIGRGFDPGTISGDSGFGAAVELRASAFNLGKLRNSVLRPYLFADVARIWNKNPGFAGPARGLLSLGGGLRVDISDRLRIDGTVAVPTETWGFTADRKVRFLLTLTTRLLPWSDR